MCHHCGKGEKPTVRTIGRPSVKIVQVLSKMRQSEPGSKAKGRSRTMRTLLAVGFAATFFLLALIPSCHGASASTSEDDGEARSLLSFSPSALKKRLGGGLRATGRSYFDAEDILLFMLGLGLASMLGLATFMAPFTSILATGLTPVTVQGNVPAASAAVTHGRRRRSPSWTDGTQAAELLLHAMEEAHGRYKKPL
ncbi:uncharacterized protein [Dermacentor andersoni]|uniref:uncharacterized protein n=1 Tax=Dermacentor andersoni TaxID=34620 RepID=UPI0024173BA5|nr:uncharacterized protein LOC129387225 [Dermacentor andersoni]